MSNRSDIRAALYAEQAQQRQALAERHADERRRELGEDEQVMAGQDDLARGCLQVAGLVIGDNGPEIEWGTLGTPGDRELTVSLTHSVFWIDPPRCQAYHRRMPLREQHLLARVVPAADVLGRGQLRIKTFPPSRQAAVVIVREGASSLQVLVPARDVELSERTALAQLTQEMRDGAAAYAGDYGYVLHGVWEHHSDGSHRITADPKHLVPQPEPRGVA